MAQPGVGAQRSTCSSPTALRPLFRDEMVVVMPPAHRLSRVPFVSAQDLGPEHLILYSIPPEGAEK